MVEGGRLNCPTITRKERLILSSHKVSSHSERLKVCLLRHSVWWFLYLSAAPFDIIIITDLATHDVDVTQCKPLILHFGQS